MYPATDRTGDTEGNRVESVGAIRLIWLATQLYHPVLPNKQHTWGYIFLGMKSDPFEAVSLWTISGPWYRRPGTDSEDYTEINN